MTEPERWNQIVEVFHAAREKTERDRQLLLDLVGIDDPELREAVEQMLRSDESAESFLEDSLLSKLGAQPPASTLTAGLKIGRYETVALIGRGGMGEVWLARDLELYRQVALKFLSPAASFGRAAERLTREARAASSLNHPNIVTVHEVIQFEQAPVIVMELVEGTSLRNAIGTPQSVERVAHVGRQIAEALAAAHAHNIVHCDIKPENIHLRADGYVKVLDFGLAHQASNEQNTFGLGSALGTLRYMPPEQASGRRLTPASDIFSLGLVLYEFAGGRHAFPAVSPFETLSRIRNEDPPRLELPKSEANRQLDQIIFSMLAREPGKRPSAKELAIAFASLEHGVTGTHVGTARYRLLLVGALCVFLIASAAIWWVRSASSRKPPIFRQVTTLVPENRATAAAISPDGKLIAYANIDGIFFRKGEAGLNNRLPNPPDFIVDLLAWMPKKQGLVVSGFSTVTHNPSIWLISMGDSPRLRLLRAGARGAAPSPDGRRIAFITLDQAQIWIMDIDGKNARTIVSGPGSDTFPFVCWSPKGRLLDFQRRHPAPDHDPESWYGDRYNRRSYESVDIATGRILSRVRDIWIDSASFLPNGQLLFLREDSGGSDELEQICVVATDPRTGAFLEAPHTIAHPVTEPQTHVYGMSTSSNGKLILYLKRSDQNAVFVGDFDASRPRIFNTHRLTLDERDSYPHAWTRDGRYVIFESDRDGGWDIFRQSIDSRTAQPIVATSQTEVLPQVSPDGKWILYAASAVSPRFLRYRLMRVPVNGGTPQEVPTGGPLDEFRCSLASNGRCVLRTTVAGKSHTFYDLDPIRGKGAELASTQWIPEWTGDWDISPDGRYVAIPEHSSRRARIRVFALSPSPNQRSERDIELVGLTDLRGLVYSAGGKAWFVSVDTTVGNRMLYVLLDGSFRELGDIQGWAVPSADGHRLAFLDRIIATNAWIIDRN